MEEKKEMIFAYFLQISNHMWEGPKNSLPRWTGHDQWDDNNNCNIQVFDELVEFIAERKYNMLVIDVGDGVQLKSHPEIAAPDAWTIDYLKEKLAWIRSKGIEVIPKLNFSACHCTWQHEWRAKMLCPGYEEFCRDVIREVAEIFDHPRFFHLGMDEENAKLERHMDGVIIRGEKILQRHMNFLCDECRKNGARPWMFADMYWIRPDEFLRIMPKDIVMSNWYYNMFDDREESKDRTRIHTYLDLDKAGYDQIPTCSAYERHLNADRTMLYLKERLNPDRLLGYITIPWTNTTAESRYSLMDDADRLYRARIKHYPETMA